MLRLVLLCAVIVSQVPARGDEPRVVAKTRMIRLATTRALASRCGDHNKHVYACAQFVGQQLTASCSAGDGAWSIRPRADYVALVYIVDQKFIYHESLHMRDMEKAVTEHLVAIESLRFASAENCEAAAASANAELPIKMREFATRSNNQRH